MSLVSSGSDLLESSFVVDLHLHSNASDGADSPSRVMERASAAGLKVVSLTDHDTVDGLEEARREAGRLGIEFVNGVELSSSHEGRLVHILGHFIRPDAPELMAQMSRYMEKRKNRMAEMIGRLLAMGVMIDPDEFMLEFGNAASIGRGHLSAYMVQKRIVNRREEVFEKYIGEGGAAYVELDMIEPAEAVRLIALAGGVASFAHPNLSGADEIIPDLIEAGLVGIEAEHLSQGDDDRRRYRDLAEQYGLVLTGGSDCHGAKPGPERLGQCRQSMGSFRALQSRLVSSD
ncbi:MAG: PHP domain-containing protein [Nitrospinaceae bacterium]|nr:PHP domain-containing protein [Nitrospinaceae bacterium]MBT3435677.1 PHP domain-containing protein [Nitrospinaceae bacterium]MBT3821244.1 PHP domain-containing protein [Nitrospinaceae bacterium]MBT4092430.1 PHP domain-containing protein [Nitrospinaceae bacterium]MBT4429711.1 PHP domain-containing protein [Nitrospinaceae bacterium]